MHYKLFLTWEFHMKGELGMITLEVVLYTLQIVYVVLGVIYRVYKLHKAFTEFDTEKK